MGDQARNRPVNKESLWRDALDVDEDEIPRETLKTLRAILTLLREQRSR